MRFKNLFLSCFYSTAMTLSAADIDITSLSDSGVGTLREALANLVEGDNLIFNSSLSGTITLQSALNDISVDVNMIGPASNIVTIDGDSTYSLVNILGGTTTITNLNFANGVNGNQAGAIYLASNLRLSLTNVGITAADASSNEKPIYVDGDATLTTHGVTFAANSNYDLPDVYLNTGTLEVNNSTLGTSTFIVDGVGSVWVKNNETAIVNTLPATTVGIAIVGDTGIAVFNGTTTEPCVANYIDGSIYGNFSCFYIFNAGKVQPGDDTTIGTIETSEDWLQTGEGTLLIKMNDSLDVDSNVVEGNASLAGTLRLKPAAGSYTEDDRYTFIVTNTGNVTGTFDTIVSDSPNLDFDIEYNSQSVDIVILNNCIVP